MLKGLNPHDPLQAQQIARITGLFGNDPNSLDTTSFVSHDYYVNDLMQGYSWTGHTGTAAHAITVSFSSATGASDSAGLTGQAVLSAAQQAGINAALQQWENVANITFVQVNGPADIDIRLANMPSGVSAWTASASTSSATQIAYADIVFDKSYNANFTPGNYAFLTALHEIGHAIGLKHPGNYNAAGTATTGNFLPTSQDNHDASVMSYNNGTYADANHNPITPMIFDVATAQYLYGANSNFNAGDTTYSFDGSAKSETIWDGGGTNTFNTSNLTTNNVINIQSGLYNVSTLGQTNVWIAYGTNIQNVIAGSGNNTIYGNQLSDLISTGNGNNLIFGDGGNSNIQTGTGNDTIGAGQGNCTINGGGGTNLIVSGHGSNLLMIDTTAGNNIVFNFKEHSTSPVADIIDISHQVFASVQAALSAITYGNNNAFIHLGGADIGETIALIGVKAGLTAADFAIV